MHKHIRDKQPFSLSLPPSLSLSLSLPLSLPPSLSFSISCTMHIHITIHIDATWRPHSMYVSRINSPVFFKRLMVIITPSKCQWALPTAYQPHRKRTRHLYNPQKQSSFLIQCERTAYRYACGCVHVPLSHYLSLSLLPSLSLSLSLSISHSLSFSLSKYTHTHSYTHIATLHY